MELGLHNETRLTLVLSFPKHFGLAGAIDFYFDINVYLILILVTF